MPLPDLRNLRLGGNARLIAAGTANALGRVAAVWSAASGNNPYTRRVALLKRTLPAIGITLLLLVMLWPRLAPIWDQMRFAFPAIDLREARDLRMLNPRYAGTDRQGRPYLLTAAAGHQVPDEQDLMSLEAPRADMKSHSGAEIVVTAATGVYQSQAQLLDLFRDVTLVHENGTRFVTARARFDIAHNAGEGDDPVEGHGPSGDVKSQGFRIYDKGETIVFIGRSEMLLNGARLVTADTQPLALPPGVAATAARIEAESKPALAAAPAPKAGTAKDLAKASQPGKPAADARHPAAAPAATPAKVKKG